MQPTTASENTNEYSKTPERSSVDSMNDAADEMVGADGGGLAAGIGSG